jgi:hypothetical protein
MQQAVRYISSSDCNSTIKIIVKNGSSLEICNPVACLTLCTTQPEIKLGRYKALHLP